MYKLYKSPISGNITGIIRSLDNAFIPFDEGNIDYQEYLTWIAEGNTPLPADE